MSFTERTAALFGKEALLRLQEAHVAVFGLGGVGSWAAEALVRTGLGKISLIDGDTIEESNINRQLPALSSTLGQKKTEVLSARFRAINPELIIYAHQAWYRPGDGEFFLKANNDCVHNKTQSHPVDFVVDCIDDVKAKADLIYYCAKEKIPVITAGACGRRVDSTKLQLGDVFEATGDPLLKRLRRELRSLGIHSLPVISSTESGREEKISKKAGGGLASAIFVPATCGLELARYTVLHITEEIDLAPPRLHEQEEN